MDKLLSGVWVGGLYALPLLLVLAAAAQMVRLQVGNAVARRPDPHLGRKLALHAFASLAVGLLVAATMTVLNVAEVVVPKPAAPPGPWWNPAQRAAAGLGLTGLVYFLLCEAVLRLTTNDRRRPAARQAAAGVRFAGCAGACMTLSAVGSLAAFGADDLSPGDVASYCGLAGVWLPAAGFHYWVMTGRRKGPPGEDRRTPETAVAIQPPPA